MPTILRYRGYNIYFWSNENCPLEPIHVHVAKTISESADKFWITKDGIAIASSNNRNLSKRDTAMITSYLSGDYAQRVIREAWITRFNEISYKE